MEFDDQARLDTSQVSDRRGRSAGSRAAIGGGGIGVVGIIIALLVTLLGGGGGGGSTGGVGDILGQLAQGGGQVNEQGVPSNPELQQTCQTGADANARQDCRIVAVVNSVQRFWEEEFARRGASYQQAKTVFFTGNVNTACGAASSEMGPFYCPADQQAYIDLGFYQELQTRFGATGGPFAEAYVIAHEYGHHLQNLLGTMQLVRTREGPDSDAVKLELQADCYAGVWAYHATRTPQADTGRPLIVSLTDADIAAGLDAAEKVGDDYIQERFQGSVSPETWTHGSSEQRQQWFLEGFRTGDLDRCDTGVGS